MHHANDTDEVESSSDNSDDVGVFDASSAFLEHVVHGPADTDVRKTQKAHQDDFCCARRDDFCNGDVSHNKEYRARRASTAKPESQQGKSGLKALKGGINRKKKGQQQGSGNRIQTQKDPRGNQETGVVQEMDALCIQGEKKTTEKMRKRRKTAAKRSEEADIGRTPAKPSDGPPLHREQSEPGVVHPPGERLAEHIVSKYGGLRLKQKQFIDNMTALSSGGTGLADDSRPHADFDGDCVHLRARLFAQCVGKEHGAMPETLYRQCKEDLTKLGSLLTRSPCNSLSTNPSQPLPSMHTDVTLLPRAYEEGFLHEASGCERPCINSASQSCFASLIESNAVLDPSFALTEFYLPDEYKQIEKSGRH